MSDSVISKVDLCVGAQVVGVRGLQRRLGAQLAGVADAQRRPARPVNVPLAELADRLAEFPADREVVAYCRGAFCVMAPDATRMGHQAGREVKRLDEGMLEWTLAGLPVEGSSAISR